MTAAEVAALAVGDKVIHTAAGWGRNWTLLTVARRTATQVVLNNGIRLNARGSIVGESGAWARGYIHPYDADQWADWVRERAQRQAANRLHNVEWRKLSANLLHQAEALIGPELPKG